MNAIVPLVCACVAAVSNEIFSSVFDSLWTSLVAEGPNDFDMTDLYDDCVNEVNWPSPMVAGMAVTGLVVGVCLGWFTFRKRNRPAKEILELDGTLDVETDNDEETQLSQEHHGQPDCELGRKQRDDVMESSRLENMLQLQEKLLVEKRQLEEELRRASNNESKLENLLEEAKGEALTLKNDMVAMEKYYEQMLEEKEDENFSLRENLNKLENNMVAMEDDYEQRLKEKEDENSSLRESLNKKKNNTMAMEDDYEKRLEAKEDANASLRENLNRAFDQISTTNLLLKEAQDQNEALKHRLVEKDELIKQKDEEIERKSQSWKEFDDRNVQEEERLSSLRMEMEEVIAKKERELNQKEKKFNLYMEKTRKDMEEKESNLVQKGKELDKRYSKLQQMKKEIKDEEKKEQKVGQEKHSKKHATKEDELLLLKERENVLFELDNDLKRRENAVLAKEKNLLEFDDELRGKGEAVMKLEKNLLRLDEELQAKEEAVMETHNNLVKIDKKLKEREEDILEAEKNLISREKELKEREESLRIEESIVMKEKLKLKEGKVDSEGQKEEEEPALDEGVAEEGEPEKGESCEQLSDEENKSVPAGEDDDDMALLSIANLFNLLPEEESHQEVKKGKQKRNRRRKNKQEKQKEYWEEENLIVLEAEDDIEIEGEHEEPRCGKHSEEEDELVIANPFNLLSEVELVEDEWLKEDKEGKPRRHRRGKRQRGQEENVTILEAEEEPEAEKEEEKPALDEGIADKCELEEGESCEKLSDEEKKSVPAGEDDDDIASLSIANPLSLLPEEESHQEVKKGKQRRNRQRRNKQEEQKEYWVEENRIVLEAGDNVEIEGEHVESEAAAEEPRCEKHSEDELVSANPFNLLSEVEVVEEERLKEDKKGKPRRNRRGRRQRGQEEKVTTLEPDDDNNLEDQCEIEPVKSDPELDIVEMSDEEDRNELGDEKSEQDGETDDEERDRGDSEEDESDDEEESRDDTPKGQDQDQPFVWRVPGLPRKRIPGRQKQRPRSPQPKKCRKKTKEQKTLMKQARAQFQQVNLKNKFQRGKKYQ
ncbi:glutamic acid-rich protein-like [Macrobrachium rosenbergii]|uniref:glutamic acid-rich protein-like n=1 Tax=Macrobrachium rosenbergii TaxID=79674 RepID=UPI0034D5A354